MKRKLCVLGIFVIAWSFYSWTARSNGKPFVFSHDARDYYNLLTDSFLAGHLYMPISPEPELLKLTDPYDPEQNAPYLRQDVSFYRGRFYLYFGAAPAVSLLLPFRLMTNLFLPEGCAVAIFLLAGLAVSYWSFQFIIRRFAPRTPEYFSVIAVLLFGFCNFAPFILRRPAFYELAIASGFFYYFASIYFLMTGLFGERKSCWRLAVAAVCLGLTLASRPNYVVIAPVALSVAMAAVLWDGLRGRDALKQLAALSVPFAGLMALLLTYNYLRFDNVFEFGQRYQLEGLRAGKYFSTAYFPYNFRAYMFSVPHITRDFPFFHLRMFRAQIYSTGYEEPVGGMFPTTPLVELTFLLIPIWYAVSSRREVGRYKPLTILATLFALNGSIMVLFLSFNGGLTERYLLDFVPSFLFSAMLVWIMLYQFMQARPVYRRVLNSILVSVLIYQLTLNTAISLTGYYDDLREENPAAYGKIRSWFSVVDRGR